VDLLAVDAVLSKTLSGVNSLLSGINTGIFATLDGETDAEPRRTTMVSKHLYIYCQIWSSEEQGIYSSLSGNSESVSGNLIGDHGILFFASQIGVWAGFHRSTRPQ
jgi:hypothetical protein